MTTLIPATAAPERSTLELPDSAKLVIQLMGAAAQQTNSVDWSLIQSLSYQERRTRAQLVLARDLVSELTSGPWLPHPDAIAQAMYPSEAAVEQWLGDHYADWRDPSSPLLKCWRCSFCRL